MNFQPPEYDDPRDDDQKMIDAEREAQHAKIREAGGIVHSDGNIFFTNAEVFLQAARSSVGDGWWRAYDCLRNLGHHAAADVLKAEGGNIAPSASPAAAQPSTNDFDKLTAEVVLEIVENFCAEMDRDNRPSGAVVRLNLLPKLKEALGRTPDSGNKGAAQPVDKTANLQGSLVDKSPGMQGAAQESEQSISNVFDPDAFEAWAKTQRDDDASQESEQREEARCPQCESTDCLSVHALHCRSCDTDFFIGPNIAKQAEPSDELVWELTGIRPSSLSERDADVVRRRAAKRWGQLFSAAKGGSK